MFQMGNMLISQVEIISQCLLKGLPMWSEPICSGRLSHRLGSPPRWHHRLHGSLVQIFLICTLRLIP